MIAADHVGTTLRQLRNQAGMTSAQAAKQAGLSQARVSRIETNTFMATPDEVRRLCRIYRAPASIGRDLAQIAADMSADAVSTRVSLQRGAYRIQQRIARIESMTDLVRGYDPGVIDGLLQTESYMRAMMSDRISGDDLERTIASRLERQQNAATRQHILIMTEGALLWQMGRPQVMVDQLEHLADIARSGPTRVGIIAHDTAATFPTPDAFHIYDARVVLLGAVHATAFITEPADVKGYLDEFDAVEALASFGDAAAAIALRVAATYRDLI